MSDHEALSPPAPKLIFKVPKIPTLCVALHSARLIILVLRTGDLSEPWRDVTTSLDVRIIFYNSRTNFGC